VVIVCPAYIQRFYETRNLHWARRVWLFEARLRSFSYVMDDNCSAQVAWLATRKKHTGNRKVYISNNLLVCYLQCILLGSATVTPSLHRDEDCPRLRIIEPNPSGTISLYCSLWFVTQIMTAISTIFNVWYLAKL